MSSTGTAPAPQRTPLRTSHGKITLVMYNAPHPCGGSCIFCFSVDGVTRSTTANEDTLLSADAGWEAGVQLERRFERYGLARGAGLKCDLAVKGDSFANHEPDYLRGFFHAAYDFLNGTPSATLAEARELQADGPDRCVTVKVETRPDQISDETCALMAELGVTGVELGVQSLDDDVLAAIERGHDVATVIEATRLLRAWGFEVGYQVMVGLPGGSLEIDEALLAEQLWLPEHSPDMLKIYPCLMLTADVASQPRLGRAFDDGWWRPMATDEYVALLERCYPRIPRWVHINGIQRMIEPERVLHGPAEKVDRRRFDGISRCLWQRSVARSPWPLDADFSGFRTIVTRQTPDTWCVEAVMDDDTLVGYGRVTLVEYGTALVRDCRALGTMRRVGERGVQTSGSQHIGVGTAVLAAAEATARNAGARQMRVRPGVGVRRWFERRGYGPAEGLWLGKQLEPRDEESR